MGIEREPGETGVKKEAPVADRSPGSGSARHPATRFLLLSHRAGLIGRLQVADLLAPPLPAESVEFPVPHTSNERVPFVGGEPQNRPSRIPAVTNADLAIGQARHLDAVAVGVTQGALNPVRT